MDIFSKWFKESSNKDWVPDGADPLKYFANDGYKNYEIISGDSSYSREITNWLVTAETATKFCVGDRIARVMIRTNRNYFINVYLGDNNEVIYVGNLTNFHIRPKKEFLDKFYNECDNFQRLLLNKDTNYKATFSVIKENDYGYYREYETLQFPTNVGGYNLDVTSYGFNDYTKRMVEIGEYYDEKFTDNLWRSMTHEAIKNFDWTHTREYAEGDEEEYVFGGRRIQKALRIFAREFDEIIPYINNIRNINRITYDERNNIPDYFLTDIVENAGWNVKLIYPYTLKEVVKIDSYVTPITEYNEQEQLNNVHSGMSYGLKPIQREFSQDSSEEVLPYSASSAHSFSSTTSWTFQKCNNEFLRRLKINSPSIWKHKGTIDGIEMILGMFGLRSKRFGGSNPDYEIAEYSSFTTKIEDTWDAEHQDYRINWINSTKNIIYDNRSVSYYNPYGYGSMKLPYQGILVSYKDAYEENDCYIKIDTLDNMIKSGVTPTNNTEECFKRADGTPVLRRFLYPSFNKDEELDGNPYFQMNGGWQAKTLKNQFGDLKRYNFQYDVDNNIVYSEFDSDISVDNDYEYNETVRNIKRVNDVNSLLSIPMYDLRNGIICSVTNIEKDSAVIDGIVYPIINEWNTNIEEVTKYISLIKDNGFIKVGNNTFFDTSICVYDYNGEPSQKDIDDKPDGYEIRAYIIDETDFICRETSEEGSYSISTFQLLDTNDANVTNYFQLDNIDYASELADEQGNNGWRRLKKDDKEYLQLNTIINDNKGNNPHNGNMVYDNGHEYFTYYKRLFKHAIDNDLFDTRCYNDYYKTLDDEISKYGFKRLINDNETFLRYENLMISGDPKIHYFGNYKVKNSGDTYLDKIYIYGDSENRVSGYRIVYENEVPNYKIHKYNLSNPHADGWIEIANQYYAWLNKYSLRSKADEVTNQIINNKFLKIIFKLHSKWYTQKGQEEIKYIDDIIMNYLTQMIPSSTILQVEYVSK